MNDPSYPVQGSGSPAKWLKLRYSGFYERTVQLAGRFAVLLLTSIERRVTRQDGFSNSLGTNLAGDIFLLESVGKGLGIFNGIRFNPRLRAIAVRASESVLTSAPDLAMFS